MPFDLTPERRRFLEILAGYPDGVPIGAVPGDVSSHAREWCKRHFLAQYVRNSRDLTHWRITEYGLALLHEPEVKP